MVFIETKTINIKFKFNIKKKKIISNSLLKFFIMNFLKQQDFLRNYPKLFLLVRNIWFFHIKGLLNKYKKKLFLKKNKTFFFF